MEPVQVYGPGWWVFVFCKWWMTAEAFLVYPFMSITQLHQSIPRQCSAGVKFNQISTDLYANFASRIWKENRLYAVFFHSPLAWCSIARSLSSPIIDEVTEDGSPQPRKHASGSWGPAGTYSGWCTLESVICPWTTTCRPCTTPVMVLWVSDLGGKTRGKWSRRRSLGSPDCWPANNPLKKRITHQYNQLNWRTLGKKILASTMKNP